MERAVDWLFSHLEEEAVLESSTAVEDDMDPAVYELFAMISHKGPSAHCGHYVSFVRKDDKWALFNDEKVAHVKNISESSSAAYLYFYRRIHL